jgi:hypothetical protein
MLQDIAILTGGQAISEDLGICCSLCLVIIVRLRLAYSMT